jgi:hypothetical protein
MAAVSQITITLTDAGSVEVNGPMENAILFNGLLEVAKESGTQYRKQLESRIHLATPALVAAVGGKNGKD